MNIMKRIVFGVTLLYAVFNAPLLFTLALASFGVFYFSSYYEIFVVGMMLDLLYGSRGGFVTGFGVLGLLISSILYWGIERAKYEFRSA